MTRIRSRESYKETGFNEKGLLEVAYRRSFSDETSKMKINKGIAKTNDVDALVNERDTEDGTTPLIHFAKKGFHKSIKKLLKNGAHVDAADIYGETALHAVALINVKKCAKHLLNYHANMDIQNNNGQTALMIAAKYGSSKVLRLLVENHANVHIKNLEGKTAIDLLAETILNRLEYVSNKMLKNSFACLRSLLEAGADLPRGANKDKIYTLIKNNVDRYEDASICLTKWEVKQNSSYAIFSALDIKSVSSDDKMIMNVTADNDLPSADVIQDNQEKEEPKVNSTTSFKI